MSYAQFLTQTVNGQSVAISVDELLRILLSGYFPDGTAYTGVGISGAAGSTYDISDRAARLLGQVKIDQTTPGTTDSVSVATGQGAGATIGTAADAAVITDAAGTLSSKLRGLIALWLGGLAAGEKHVGEVGGDTVTVGIEFTRPADTAIYAAKDVVCNSVGAPAALVFTNVARVVAGSGYIVKARLMTDQVACVARFRLHLFNTTPAPIADNALYTLLYANAAARIGHIDFPAMQTEGAGSTAANAILVPNMSNLVMAYVAGGATRNLFGILTTLDVFTPASGQKFYVTLSAENN